MGDLLIISGEDIEDKDVIKGKPEQEAIKHYRMSHYEDIRKVMEANGLHAPKGFVQQLMMQKTSRFLRAGIKLIKGGKK